MDDLSSLLQRSIASPIGNNQDSDPEDVKQTREKLNALGFDIGNLEYGYIDKPLDNAIRTFQNRMNLKEDGLINPKGDTEKALNKSLKLINTHVTPPLPDRKPAIPEEKQQKIEQLTAEDILLDDSINELWMRQVQKDPSQFLRIKFHMQLEK